MKRNKLKHIKPTENSFKVPKGYFDTVEDAVLAKLSAEKLSDKEGFSTPEIYFENIEDSVLERIKKERSSQSALPANKQTGFSIPENYLNTVEDTITAKLNDDTKQVKVINFRTVLLKRIVPFAAAAVLLLVYINYNPKTTSNSFDTLALSDIEQWIENDLITFDSYEIAEVYNDTELENATIFDEDELVEYLDGMDIESLLLEN
jgi:hypothetical protein